MSKIFALAALATAAAIGVAKASDDRIGVINISPSPSPTTSQFVFSSDVDAPTAQLHLWIASLDGSSVSRINTGAAALVDEEPAWSPDGQSIAFSSNNGVTSDIWVATGGGQTLTQLTSKALNNRQPAWSPDGKKIAFVSDRGGSNDIWIMNADGTGQTRLTRLPGQEDHPSFSPDGSAIVFSETTGASANLLIVNVDGGNLRTLTSGPFKDWNPSWGAKGILFSSNRDPASIHFKIWNVQPDGAGLARIGDTLAVDPVWTRDGKILFSDEVSGARANAAISLLDPATGLKTVINTMDGFNAPIDIRPGKTPNFINPRSEGRVSVAILSSATFDAPTVVDQSSLRFGPTGTEANFRNCLRRGAIDVNRDGKADLVCRFSIRAAGFKRGDSVGVLRFADKNGLPYEGRDVIVTIDRDDDDDFNDN